MPGMGRIQDTWLKIKTWVDEALAAWGLVAIVLLTVVSAFGLGRLSVIVEPKPLVTITAAAAAVNTEPMDLGGYVVASRSGEVYYLPWCAGAGQIAVTNKRWFKSEEEARRAGYRPAKNCRGLE